MCLHTVGKHFCTDRTTTENTLVTNKVLSIQLRTDMFWNLEDVKEQIYSRGSEIRTYSSLTILFYKLAREQW